MKITEILYEVISTVDVDEAEQHRMIVNDIGSIYKIKNPTSNILVAVIDTIKRQLLLNKITDNIAVSIIKFILNNHKDRVNTDVKKAIADAKPTIALNYWVDAELFDLILQHTPMVGIRIIGTCDLNYVKSRFTPDQISTLIDGRPLIVERLLKLEYEVPSNDLHTCLTNIKYWKTNQTSGVVYNNIITLAFKDNALLRSKWSRYYQHNIQGVK
jgi:hypothetical protein